MKHTKKLVHDLAAKVDVHINGTRPWDITIHDERFYHRIIRHGSLGLGESYMQGWWECNQLDRCLTNILSAQITKEVKPSMRLLIELLKARIFNLQSQKRAYQVGQQHYDLGNDLYEAMLDKRLVYTCAYWKDAYTLDQAQEAKLDLVCKKLHIKPGQKILDIGCGWGSFAKYAAEKYDVQVVGITIAKEQVTRARELCKGLPVEIRLQDYRDINEPFDHIVSLGMFEHVGYKNYRTYMEVAHRCLKDNGLFLLHTIGSNTTSFSCDPWLDKYIFPNGMLPSIKQIGAAIEGLFVMEDWHNFSAYYDKTLMAWYANIQKNWHQLSHRYNGYFKRMWDYYLLSCAAVFRSRHGQLWQVVLSKNGMPGGYNSVR